MGKQIDSLKKAVSNVLQPINNLTGYVMVAVCTDREMVTYAQHHATERTTAPRLESSEYFAWAKIPEGLSRDETSKAVCQMLIDAYAEIGISLAVDLNQMGKTKSASSGMSPG